MEKVKVKRQKVLDLWNTISAMGRQEKTSAKFAYALAKTADSIEGEIMAIKTAQNPSPEFEKARIDLCYAYAQRGPNGDPITTMIDGALNYKISEEKEEEFNKKLDELRQQHSETHEAQRRRYDETQEMLLEDVEIEVHKISQDQLPEEILPSHLKNLLPMITDSEE